MSGFEFFDVLRKRFPQVPLAVVSAIAADEVPEGMVADAHFHMDGFGFEQLLETLWEVASKPPPRAVLPHADRKSGQARWDTDAPCIVECEDCLRSFRASRAPIGAGDEKWTVCVHRGSVVRFVVARPDAADPTCQ